MEKSKTTGTPQRSGIKKRIAQVFWLVFLVLSLAYAWYCFYAPSNQIVWADGFDDAQQQSIKSEKPMLLFFTADWCSPCRIMKRTVWADTAVTAEVNRHFIPVELYAGDPDAAHLFTRYNISGTPVTLLIRPDGSVIDYAAGKIDKPAFLELLQTGKQTTPNQNHES